MVIKMSLIIVIEFGRLVVDEIASSEGHLKKYRK